MILSTLSSLLSAWFAFFLPCYATFKVLSHRPVEEAELQKYAMYWCVIGAFSAFEYVTEWLISWLPFYWEVKCIFLLYLSLPQTQGSTYIYLTYIQPFFLRNEKELDEGILALQRNILSFLRAKLSNMWELVSTKQQQPTNQGNPPVSWLSPDTVRAALSMIYTSAGSQTPTDAVRQKSNVGTEETNHETSTVATPFSVPRPSLPSS